MSKLIELMLAADVQWPVGAKWAAQDADGEVKFSADSRRPTVGTDDDGVWVRLLFSMRYALDVANDRATAIISHDEYQAAGGWMEWKGGECPVDEDAIVHAKWSDGDETTRALSSSFSWFASGSLPNIIAYRIVTQPATRTIYHGGELYRHAVILLQTEQTLVWRCDGSEYCCKPRQALIDPDDNGLAAAILARLCGADVAPEHVREMREQMGWV